MNNIKLTDLNFYENDNILYIGYGDGYLSKIEGEDVIYVKSILKNLLTAENAIPEETLFENVSESIEIDKDYFTALLSWMKSNGVIEFVSNETEKNKVLSVALIGLLENEQEKLLTDLNDLFKTTKYTFVVKEYTSAVDFCLIFSPILSKNINAEIFDDIYRRQIPHVYLDYSPYAITIGPAINPALKMFCLSCFFKRRIANTNNPINYLKLIRLDNKQMRQVSLLDCNVYHSLTEWLRNELEILLNSDWKNGSIMGKSKAINFISDEFDVARVLKVSGCKTCNQREAYRPLNG